MEQEQLLKLQSLLRYWRSERHLDAQKQNANLEANLLEEVVEYLRAKNEYEQVDALCDINVFSLNALDEDIDLSIDNTILKDTTHTLRHIAMEIANFVNKCLLETINDFEASEYVKKT